VTRGAVVQELKTTLARTAAAAAEMNESLPYLKTIAGDLLTAIHTRLQASFSNFRDLAQQLETPNSNLEIRNNHFTRYHAG
jgi:hypothetical protein